MKFKYFCENEYQKYHGFFDLRDGKSLTWWSASPIPELKTSSFFGKKFRTQEISQIVKELDDWAKDSSNPDGSRMRGEQAFRKILSYTRAFLDRYTKEQAIKKLVADTELPIKVIDFIYSYYEEAIKANEFKSIIGKPVIVNDDEVLLRTDYEYDDDQDVKVADESKPDTPDSKNKEKKPQPDLKKDDDHVKDIDDLTDWIKKELKNGFTLDTIILTFYKYRPKTFTNELKLKGAIMGALFKVTHWVENELKAGKTLDSILVVIKQHYPPNIADAVIKQLQK